MQITKKQERVALQEQKEAFFAGKNKLQITQDHMEIIRLQVSDDNK